MDESTESLATRRSKRSTAGNRMEAALAEFRAEDIGVDAEDDVDFNIEKDEEDVFGSDFESTDEEAVPEDVDMVAEKVVQDEEKTTRKTARSKLDKVTAAAHARQRATFNPEAQASSSSAAARSAPEKMKRRVSLGVAVNAETGEVLERSKRHSQRRHTILNTSLTAERVKEEEQRKSALPKKTKTKIRAPTQTELIARALDMEEGNIVEHREYLSLEEEKRRKARLIRTAIQGPLLRWVSKTGEEIVKVVPPPPPPAPVYPASTSSHAPNHSSPHYYGYSVSPGQTGHPNPGAYYYYHPPYTPNPQGSAQQPSHAQPGPSQQSYVPGHLGQSITSTSSAPAQAAPDPIERTEKVSKNYVVHEISQVQGSRPTWLATMKAMFGDDVKWDELRVYTNKGRPLYRPSQTCPMTGKTALYRDPRTNVPFADIGAYDTLTKLLSHEYIWSPTLGCYIAREGSVFAPDRAESASTSRKRARNAAS
ncbi:hypothetical protein CERSUDRAFT_146509 [Gelatoporia subvermispora B]|uniref:Vps72/YL1 C-terminal domain-containing protein n=1 Tax=Ceriporiopsis subvermispora (strain B) TaxID=914234 RepID=M2RSU0_CERS8|nr:hypothetical protein CERSUDRAFT_146509 [Gelatoporia subvermispora B]